MSKFIFLALLSGVLSAIAQVLLKTGALKNPENGIRTYLNPYVIGGYGLTFLCMLLMVLAYRGLSYKWGAILEVLVYIYIPVLSRFIFKEKITKRMAVGICFIAAGVIVFSL